MILQALTRYYEVLAREEKVSRKGWCTAKVSYAVKDVYKRQEEYRTICVAASRLFWEKDRKIGRQSDGKNRI